MSDRTSLEARWFNAGSDARLSGIPLRYCPFEESSMASAWRHGWKDVDKYWGTLSQGYPVRPLPVVENTHAS